MANVIKFSDLSSSKTASSSTNVFISQEGVPAKPFVKVAYPPPIVENNAAFKPKTQGQEFVKFIGEDFGGAPSFSSSSKSTSTEDSGSAHAVETAIAECRAECAAIKGAANIKAADIIHKAQEECERIKKEVREKTVEELEPIRLEAKKAAYQEGYDQGVAEGIETGKTEGFAQGFSEGRAKCESMFNELAQLLSAIEKDNDKTYLDLQDKFFDLTFEIAQKVTFDSLKQKDKNIISKLIKEGAKSFRSSTFVQLTLSELDLKATVESNENVASSIQATIDTFKQNFPEASKVDVVVSKTLPSGTVVIEDEEKKVDAGIPTQLNLIRQIAMGKFRNNKAKDE